MTCSARVETLLLLGLAAICCGSGDAPEHFGRVRFETEHFRYYAADGAAVCENTGYWLERFYSSISDYLELPRSRLNKIVYEWVGAERGDVVQQACRSDAGGCAQGQERVVSVQAFSAHELTHIIAAQYGEGVSFFVEGLAEMLDCGHLQVSERLDKTLFQSSMLTDKFADLGAASLVPRRIARSFVFYLTHRFEKREFLQFYAAVDSRADLSTIESRFLSAFQIPLDEAIADWQAVPERQDESCQYLVQCDGDAATGTVPFQTDCGMESTPEATDAFVPFEVGASGHVIIEDDNTSATLGLMNVYSCDGGAAGLAELGVAAQTRYLITRPGRHFAWIRTDDGKASGTLTFGDPAPATDSCPAAGTPLTLAPNRWLVVSRRWQPSACSGFPWCPGDSINFIATEDGELAEVDYFWGRGLPITSPQSVYRCSSACPSDPSASCQSDLLSLNTSGRWDFNVVNSSFLAGDVVHLAAGPTGSADDPFAMEYFVVRN